MNLHEYQAKSLLAGMGMPCPKVTSRSSIHRVSSFVQFAVVCLM